MADKPKFGPRPPIGFKVQGRMKAPAGTPTPKSASGLSERAIKLFKIAKAQHKVMTGQTATEIAE